MGYGSVVITVLFLYVFIISISQTCNKNLLKKPQIIIANKMDVESAKDNLVEFKKKLNNKDIKIFEVSALTNNGLQEVVDYLGDILEEIKPEDLYDEESFESHVLYKFKKEEPFTITKENDEWVIRGKEVEKLFKMTKFNTDESIMRFAKRLRKMGIDDKLIELGAQEGDMVRILDFYFEFK